MPRYKYMCEECTVIASVIHLMDESITDCPECKAENSMKKMLSTPHIVSTVESTEKAPVGVITNEYIELNRQILEQEKIKAKQEEHEPT